MRGKPYHWSHDLLPMPAPEGLLLQYNVHYRSRIKCGPVNRNLLLKMHIASDRPSVKLAHFTQLLCTEHFDVGINTRSSHIVLVETAFLLSNLFN
jgi:hypothetical protein